LKKEKGRAHFFTGVPPVKKPGFPLQSFGFAKRISAAIPCAAYGLYS
jgi:hypothetical protein